MLGFYNQALDLRSPTYGGHYGFYGPPAYPYNSGYGIAYASLYANSFLYPRFGIGLCPRSGRGRVMGRGRGWRRW